MSQNLVIMFYLMTERQARCFIAETDWAAFSWFTKFSCKNTAARFVCEQYVLGEVSKLWREQNMWIIRNIAVNAYDSWISESSLY